MVTRPNAIRVAKALLLLCCWPPVLLVVASDAWQVSSESEAKLRQWRKWSYRKVRKESERLVVLAQDLCKEVRAQEGKQLSSTVEERVRALEKQARELRAAVAAVDENILSLSVVRRAEEIKNEARSLREIFEKRFQGKQRKKLRDLARKIEKRADFVADHMRSP